MKNRRTISMLLAVAMVITMMPFTSFAAAKKSSVKTYVFFGSDSRANDDSWKSVNGGKIKMIKAALREFREAMLSCSSRLMIRRKPLM